MRERFREERDKLPIMFVVSPVDADSLWSKDSPTKLVFQRLGWSCFFSKRKGEVKREVEREVESSRERSRKASTRAHKTHLSLSLSFFLSFFLSLSLPLSLSPSLPLPLPPRHCRSCAATVRFARSAEAAANRALLSVGSGLLGGQVLNARSIFATPTAAFDVIFHISPAALSLRHTPRAAVGGEASRTDGTMQQGQQGADLKFKNLQLKETVREVGRPGFDPIAQVFRELQRRYQGRAMFWFDQVAPEMQVSF